MTNTTPRKLTPEQEASLIRRYRTGEDPTTIYTSLGISKGTFYNTLKRLDAAPNTTATRLPEETRAEVAQLYRDGADVRVLMNTYSLSKQTVYNILADHNITLRQPGKRLDAAEHARIVEECLSGAHTNEVAERFGVSQATVFRVLREQSVVLPKGRPKIHELNDAAFDELTPEALYWMGFLFSDGCIHHDGNGQPTLVCGLGEKDLDHLEKLRAFCGSTHKIYHQIQKPWTDGEISVPERTVVYWRVRSARICAALETRGIVTKRTRVPVPELAQSRDFWRGCMDGDGALGTSASGKYIYPDIRLAGQRPLLTAFQYFLREISTSLNILDAGMRNGSVFEVHASGSTALRIIELLYKDATVALARKNERAQTLLRGEIVQFDSYKKPAR